MKVGSLGWVSSLPRGLSNDSNLGATGTEEMAQLVKCLLY